MHILPCSCSRSYLLWVSGLAQNKLPMSVRREIGPSVASLCRGWSPRRVAVVSCGPTLPPLVWWRRWALNPGTSRKGHGELTLSHGHALYWPLRVKSIETWGTWGKEGQVRPVRGLWRHPIHGEVKDEVSGVPAGLAAAQGDLLLFFMSPPTQETLRVPSRPHGAPKSAFFIWGQLCMRV